MPEKSYNNSTVGKTRWLLVFYDLCIYAVCFYLLIVLHPSIARAFRRRVIRRHMIICGSCIFGSRFIMRVYSQIWRYANMNAYLRLIIADAIGTALYVGIEIGYQMAQLTFIRSISLCFMDLLAAITARMFYYYFYENASKDGKLSGFYRTMLKLFGRVEVKKDEPADAAALARKIKVAIVGAGRVGATLAEDLLTNPNAPYIPVCFVDIDEEKTGRSISGLMVYSDKDITKGLLDQLGVQEIIFALPNANADKRNSLYQDYKELGYKAKIYDYPIAQSTGSGRRALRDFDIEDLLFRDEKTLPNEAVKSYYRGKTILVSGGGGSIGSEICRQLAGYEPKKLVILDIYENGAYDLQQELRISYGKSLETQIEIASVTDRDALERIFDFHRPDVVIHAAAHKHVPLMEHNSCEAIKNNVFGTLNVVETAEKFGVSKFIMVSTDKAVNPTNVMGATKRMCEMIVLNRNNGRSDYKTSFSTTRFGNVLGSSGSVIPLFKRQIANGGPVTVTDRRIIRYFMTIPEAARLVLQSGAMAKNGELYVLDMGKPVKILELAESMIRLSGLEPYKDIQIVETGLREGEKLYEELLTKSETLGKTENDLIFTEKDSPVSREEIEAKLASLAEAAESGDDARAMAALKEAVPTYRSPEEVNAAQQ